MRDVNATKAEHTSSTILSSIVTELGSLKNLSPAPELTPVPP